MGRIRRYRTALSRHHRSKGHGIHSPFAYAFVRDVLLQRLPYYSYEIIGELRRGVIEQAATYKKHPRVMSLKNAKMLFRIANFFNPEMILQVGTHYGLSTASMMLVSGTSRVALYEPHIATYPVVAQVLGPFIDGIDSFSNLDAALGCYAAAVEKSGALPFVVVNNLPLDEDYDKLKSHLCGLLRGEAVVVMRNLSRSSAMKRLWSECKAEMTHGQSFTNEKIAVVVALKQLNKEHFFLWF